MRWAIGFILAIGLIVGTAGVEVAIAQQPPAVQQPAGQPKSFLPPAGSRQPGAAATAPSGFYGWVAGLQHGYNQRLAKAVRDLKTGNPFLAVMTLAGLSFVYGVLHAAGPGHGKAVISSYVLASEQTVRRGIALSFLAALFQAFSALILVAILVYGLSATGLAIKTTEAWLETLSWALVALIGGWLVWRQIREWQSERVQTAVATGATAPRHDGHSHGHHAHHGDHGHPQHHVHSAACQHDHGHVHGPDCGHVHGPGCTHHDHQHGSAHAACCDHAHMPDPAQLQGAWSWRKALSLAAAIGIRPCTGAILVLVFAIGQGLAWAGVFATFAMALGTAITVSTLAALAIGSRELAARLGRDSTGGWGQHVRRFAGIGGSLAVMILGIILFIGSLGPSAGI